MIQQLMNIRQARDEASGAATALKLIREQMRDMPSTPETDALHDAITETIIVCQDIVTDKQIELGRVAARGRL